MMLGLDRLGPLAIPCFAAFTLGGEKRRGGCCKGAWALGRGGLKGKPPPIRTGGLGASCIYSLCPAVPNMTRFTKCRKARLQNLEA